MIDDLEAVAAERAASLGKPSVTDGAQPYHATHPDNKGREVTGTPLTKEIVNYLDFGMKIETKEYGDGTAATGVAPLPEQSPEQQKSGGESNG